MGKPIIDIHSHILPGLDDGAMDWEECRQMLHMAYEQGIRTIVATPHYSPMQDLEKIREIYLRVREEAQEVAPDFQVLLGQEVLYFESMVEQLRMGHVLTMAETHYVLIEFLPTASFKAIYQAVRKLIMSGYHPILAHVERYVVLRKEEHLRDILNTGCYLQMNYQSLEGRIWNANVRWCRKQIKEGHIHLLGTDAHHAAHRSPKIEVSRKWLLTHAEETQAERLMYTNAHGLLQSN